MPSFTPRQTYQLTSTQVDLIIYSLQYMEKVMTHSEQDEASKITEELNSSFASTDPYPHNPEDDYYITCDY